MTETRKQAASRSQSPNGKHPSWHALGIPDALVDVFADRVAARLAARQPEPAPAGYLNVEQACDYLGSCPKSRVYELVEKKRLTVHRDGRRLLFKPADLDAALDLETAE